MKLNETKFFVITLLLALNLLTALLLESSMKTGFIAELVLIFIGILITAAIVFGYWIEEPWIYPLSAIVFAVSLANLIWIFAITKIFLTFAFGLIVNVSGLVMCLASIEHQRSQELETYEVPASKKKKRR